MIKLEEGKYKFATVCDISPTAYVFAEEFIRKELNPDFDLNKKLTFTVKVASQAMRYAIPLMYTLGGHVELDFDYKEDEWSLTGFYYDKEYKRTSITVWSPGA